VYCVNDDVGDDDDDDVGDDDDDDDAFAPKRFVAPMSSREGMRARMMNSFHRHEFSRDAGRARGSHRYYT